MSTVAPWTLSNVSMMGRLSKVPISLAKILISCENNAIFFWIRRIKENSRR